jgi:hypothetical protein
MSRPQSYSHVLATFVAEATRDARASTRASRAHRERRLREVRGAATGPVARHIRSTPEAAGAVASPGS